VGGRKHRTEHVGISDYSVLLMGHQHLLGNLVLYSGVEDMIKE